MGWNELLTRKQMADAFCEVEVPEYVPKECGIERAGIIAVAIIAKNEGFNNNDLETLNWWNNKLDDSPALWFLIQQTRGEYPGGTPTEEEGFGTESTQVTGADHAVPLEVEGLKDNRDFWEGVNRKKWKVVFFTNGGLMFYVSVPVTVYATPNNPKSPKAGAFWKVSFKWQDISNPVILETPTGLLSN